MSAVGGTFDPKDMFSQYRATWALLYLPNGRSGGRKTHRVEAEAEAATAAAAAAKAGSTEYRTVLQFDQPQVNHAFASAMPCMSEGRQDNLHPYKWLLHLINHLTICIARLCSIA